MSRSCSLALLPLLLFGSSLFAANDAALWQEYGLAGTQHLASGADRVTAYRMKDPTGAIAAWQWLRTEKSRSCGLGSFCTAEPGRTIVAQENYVLAFEGPQPSPSQYKALFAALPGKHDTALPAILSFLPTKNLVPHSARYILGPVSYSAFAPKLAQVDPGFNEEVEAQVADYRVGRSRRPIRLVLFYYPSPSMARQHLPAFEKIPGVYAKRSALLLGVIPSSGTPQEAQTVLKQVQYKAKIVMDAATIPGPNSVKSLVTLIVNLIILSALLACVCILGGLIYAGMRIYRRRYGKLDSSEAMTTLGLSDRWHETVNATKAGG